MRRAILALLFFSLSAMQAFGLSVGPLALRLDPLAGRSYATIVATNNSDRSIAVETYVERREVDQNGKQTLVRVEDDFIVFPPITRMQAGQRQAFRVQFIGDAAALEASNYYVTVEQLPISAEEAQAEAEAAGESTRLLLRLGYAFKVAIGIAPNGATPEMSIRAAGPGAATEDGKPTLRVVIANSGRGYGIVSQYTVLLRKPNGEEFSTVHGDWGEAAGVSLFPSGHERSIDIPVPDASWAQGTSASIEQLN